MRASPKDLHSPVKILSRVSSDIWWAGKFMKIITTSGEMFLIPVTAGRELGTGFGASAEYLQLSGNFCKSSAFSHTGPDFLKCFCSDLSQKVSVSDSFAPSRLAPPCPFLQICNNHHLMNHAHLSSQADGNLHQIWALKIVLVAGK